MSGKCQYHPDKPRSHEETKELHGTSTSDSTNRPADVTDSSNSNETEKT